MATLDPTYFLWAVFLGGLSAVSLPLGSVVGIMARPRPTVTATLAAFGAGALIAALSIELVAPTVEALHRATSHRLEAVISFWALVVGAAVGGVLFIVLNQLVNARGGFLRKWATTITHFRNHKREQMKLILEDLCMVSLLRALPPKQIGLLVNDVRPATFADGEILFQEGDRGDKLFFIRSGDLELLQGAQLIETLKPGQAVGELELLTRTPRTVTARAKGEVRTLFLCYEDLIRWRQMCPELDQALRELASQQLNELREHQHRQHAEAEAWATRAIAALSAGRVVPTPAEIQEMRAQHSGAPLAVWLGLLLDGIPESVVIGTGLVALVSMRLTVTESVSFLDVIPYTLIAGLVLSNFPEAMASSVGMKEHGWRPQKIVWMWTLLMLVTAFGAGVGYLLGEVVPPVFLIAIEGIAAGAMLTMLASTMIPEAVHLGGGSIVGISTLTGFLSAITFKLFE